LVKISSSIALSLVGTILGVPLVAGRLQQAESRQPSFRSGVNLVLVDMRVAAGANAIRDLRMDEITLLIWKDRVNSKRCFSVVRSISKPNAWLISYPGIGRCWNQLGRSDPVI
jgi:hypothetical protein